MINPEFDRCKNTLLIYGIEERDIFSEEENFTCRKASGLEVLGVVYSVYKFLKKIHPELTIENSYELYSAQYSDGGFDMWDDIQLNDEFFINSFFVSENVVIVNICNKEGYGVAQVRVRER